MQAIRRVAVCLLLVRSLGSEVGVAQSLGAAGDFDTPFSGPRTTEPSGIKVQVTKPCVRRFRVKLDSPQASGLRIVTANGTTVASKRIQTTQKTYWRNVTTTTLLRRGHHYRELIDAQGQDYYTGYSQLAVFPVVTEHFTAVRARWNGSSWENAFGIFAAVTIVEGCAQTIDGPEELPTAPPTPTQIPSSTPQSMSSWTITVVGRSEQPQTSSWAGTLLLLPIICVLLRGWIR